MRIEKNIVGSLVLVSLIAAVTGCGGGGSSNGGSAAAALTSHVFSANNGVDGRELFISNGTSEGTRILKDINIGTDWSSPEQFIKLGDSTYFVANDGVNGEELWKTDGTEAGTVIVKDIHTAGSSSPSQLTVFKDKLYFVAFQPSTRKELWVSDGTEAGTMLLKEIISGAFHTSQIGSMMVVGDSLFFTAVGPASEGKELWKSDGTTDGTEILKDIKPGQGVGSYPEDLTNVDGTLYFSARDGSVTNDDRALWKTDGTEAGTLKLNTAGNSLSPTFFSNMTAVGSRLFF